MRHFPCCKGGLLGDETQDRKKARDSKTPCQTSREPSARKGFHSMPSARKSGAEIAGGDVEAPGKKGGA